jgi:hypothetical protein
MDCTGLVPPYRLNVMQIVFSSVGFVHSKESVAKSSQVDSDTPTIQGPVPSSESMYKSESTLRYVIL